MKNLTQFGTYGFLSLLMAAQMASSPELFTKSSKKSLAGAKKSSRSVKREMRKSPHFA